MSAESVPAVRVSVDGAVPHSAVRVLAVRVAACFNAPAQCELTLDDLGGDASWPGAFTLEGRLRVEVVGAPGVLFDGEVTCVELARTAGGATTARVRAYDVLHRLRKRQTLRVLTDVSITDLASTLTADTGLTVDGPDTPVVPRVVQHRQSDLELLTATAARAGLLSVVDGQVLRLTTLEGYGEAVPLVFGSSLSRVAVEANMDRSTGAVTALGWDIADAAAVSARVSRPRTGRRVAMTVPDGGDVSLVEQPGSFTRDLTGVAQLALDTRAAQSVVLRGTARGDAGIRPGVRVDVTGVSTGADGRYVVCEAVHTVDTDGFTTTFSTAPPPLPRVGSGATITLGRVLAVDDPDGRGRVRVALPAWGDPDVGWVPVVCPGAGRDKGLVILPDVGDTVAVALPHGDPGAALVLGSLYGGVLPPDPGVTGAAVRRWSWVTADGQSVVLDDDAHAVRLTNRAGSAVELTPDTVRITAKADLTIDAAGHAITIRSRSVDFEHAPV